MSRSQFGEDVRHPVSGTGGGHARAFLIDPGTDQLDIEDPGVAGVQSVSDDAVQRYHAVTRYGPARCTTVTEHVVADLDEARQRPRTVDQVTQPGLGPAGGPAEDRESDVGGKRG